MDNKYSTQPALVEQLLRRDPKGCEHLCESYSGIIYGFITRIVNDTEAAEQLLEKTFKAICKNINQYKYSQVTFLTWVLQLARSVSIDYLCVNKQKTAGIENSYTDKSEVNEAIDAIAIFDMTQQGYKAFEVAEILGITVEEVKVNIRKAMKIKANAN